MVASFFGGLGVTRTPSFLNIMPLRPADATWFGVLRVWGLALRDHYQSKLRKHWQQQRKHEDNGPAYLRLARGEAMHPFCGPNILPNTTYVSFHILSSPSFVSIQPWVYPLYDQTL